MSKIVQEPHEVLRNPASIVAASEIGSEKIKKIIKDMSEALSREEDGVAIAAPQIGVPLRIFLISQKASKKFDKYLVFINPEIIKLGRKKEEMSEGCLSVRWKYGLVKRSLTTTVRALNEDGNEFVMRGEGLLSQIFQHEVDHLNGVLFIDKARDIKDMPPEKDVKQA